MKVLIVTGIISMALCTSAMPNPDATKQDGKTLAPPASTTSGAPPSNTSSTSLTNPGSNSTKKPRLSVKTIALALPDAASQAFVASVNTMNMYADIVSSVLQLNSPGNSSSNPIVQQGTDALAQNSIYSLAKSIAITFLNVLPPI